jgi:TonB family protein
MTPFWKAQSPVLLCLLVLPLAAFASDPPVVDLATSLETKYVHKLFTLRGFPIENYLQYDNKGNTTHRIHPGSWTSSLMVTEHVKVTAKNIELDGARWGEVYDSKQSKLVAKPLKEKVQIVVDRDATQPDSAILDAIKQIFISENESLADLVPDYWKPWVSGGWETVPQEDGSDCHRRKGEVSRTADGGTWMNCEEHARTKTLLPPANSIDVASLPYRVGKGMTPPKAIFAPDPEYSSLARAAHFQATVVLLLTVKANGDTTDVTIAKPSGLGLDEQAVVVVKTWRFQPATLNHQPVAVEINVEVEFRL